MSEKPKNPPLAEEFKVAGQFVPYYRAAYGYLARPRKKGSFPGVVMIHDRWGLDEFTKKMARELAKNGYAVLAVDLFSGQVTADSKRAVKLMSAVEPDKALENMRAALAYLRAEQLAEKIASLGWGFGGDQALRLELWGEKLDGLVVYYGQLDIGRELLEKISCPVLGFFGEQDGEVALREVKEFEAALQALGIENEIYVYAGLGHAFADPGDSRYAPTQSRDAWEKTLAFLNRNLKYFFRKIKIEVNPFES